MAPYNFNRNGSVVAVPLSNHQEKDVSTTNQCSAVERRFLGDGFHLVDDYVDENKAGWRSEGKSAAPTATSSPSPVSWGYCD